MNFTLSILDYFLNQIYRTIHRGPWNHRQIIRNILLWDGSENQRDTLYLVPQTYEILPQKEPPASIWHNLLFIMEEQPFSSSADHPEGYFVICPDGEILSAVNNILTQFLNFQNWTNQVTILSKTEHNFQELLKISGSYLNMSLTIIDRNYHIAAQNNVLSLPWMQFSPMTSNMTMSVSDVQTLYLDDPDFDDTFSQNGLIRYHQDGYSELFHVYYYNFHYQGQYLARLLIAMPCEADCPGARLLAEYLANALSECYCYYQEQQLKQNHNEALYDALQNLFQGKQVEKAPVIQLLKSIGWSSVHEYQMLKFIPEGYVNSKQTLEYFCAKIEETFSSCLAVQLGDGILCLRNTSIEPDSEQFQKKLPYFLRENLFRVGISNLFSDFFNCYLYGREATEALLLGCKENASLWRYDFSSYGLQYILKKAPKTILLRIYVIQPSKRWANTMQNIRIPSWSIPLTNI